MSISGIGNGSSWFSNWGSADKTKSAEGVARTRAPLQQLGADLRSGDLAAAQGDFAAITGASGRPMNSRDATDFGAQMGALGTALQNGDLPAAQAAFQKISGLVNRSGLHSMHHHRHHHSGAQGAAPTAPDASPADPFAPVFDSLGAAVQTGDFTGAQNAFTNLQSLLENAPERKTAFPSGNPAPSDPTVSTINLRA